jgi:hypothetical protein
LRWGSFAFCPGASAQPDLAELARQSTVIVGAPVVRLRAASVSGVPASDNTVILKVDRVYDAPCSIAGLAGPEITVLANDPGTPPARSRHSSPSVSPRAGASQPGART